MLFCISLITVKYSISTAWLLFNSYLHDCCCSIAGTVPPPTVRVARNVRPIPANTTCTSWTRFTTVTCQTLSTVIATINTYVRWVKWAVFSSKISNVHYGWKCPQSFQDLDQILNSGNISFIIPNGNLSAVCCLVSAHVIWQGRRISSEAINPNCALLWHYAYIFFLLENLWRSRLPQITLTHQQLGN